MTRVPDLCLDDRFDVDEMVSFMRTPAIYWSASDALAPAPEQMDLKGYLLHPDTWTCAATYKGQIIGYVLFNRRTSIGAEIHCGFHEQARGQMAKTFVDFAVSRAFSEKGLLKLWAIIPSDNRAACMLAGACGFVREGRLTNAIVRHGAAEGRPPLRDLIILGRSRPDVRN